MLPLLVYTVLYLLQFYLFHRQFLPKPYVVLDNEHGRLVLFDQRLDLHSREYVYVVQRLVPDVEMSGCEQA